MAEIEITKASTRGQIVLPKSIRDRIGICSGDFFAVYSDGDTIFIKKIEMKRIKELFEETSKEFSKHAKKIGLTKKMIEEAVANERKKNKGIS